MRPARSAAYATRTLKQAGRELGSLFGGGWRC
jgi:hypothetical protein